MSFPAFAKDYAEYSELRTLLKQVDNKHADLVDKILSDATAGELNADRLVADLFEKSKIMKASGDRLVSAVWRVRLGNPPGKENSLGDAVNWECLLAEVPNGTDVYLVSEDKDFRSQLSVEGIHEFLEREWKEKKNSNIYFFPRISSFFKEHFPNIKLASEAEKDLLIQKLANSGSFAATHSVIAQFTKHTNFSMSQVEELTKIARANSQVSWIITDSDVHEFYRGLLERHGSVLNSTVAKELAGIVEAGQPEAGSDDELTF